MSIRSQETPANTMNEKRIREALTAGRTPEPPADLAENIKSEVPSRLELASELASGTGDPGSSRRWLAAAAVVLVALGAGIVGVRVLDRTGDPTRSADAGAEPRSVAGLAMEGDGLTDPTPGSASSPTPSESEPAPASPVRQAGERRSHQPRPERDTAADGDDSAVPAPSPELREHVRARAEGMELRKQLADSAIQQAPKVRPDEESESPLEVDGVVVTDMAAIGDSPPGAKHGSGQSRPYYEVQQNREIRPETEPARVRAKRVAPKPAPSTGGTAEPNDRPYGDVFFRGYGTNPFVDAEDDPLSTFGLDVDTGSWGVVRRYLDDGNLPPREAVRVEELVNAFDYGDPPPAEGDFRIVVEGARTPFADRRDEPRYRLVRFGLRARAVDVSERQPAILTFAVDVSGSMAREDRLGLVRRALVLLLDQLREGDRVALVVYGSRGRVVLDHTGDLEAIRSAVGRLTPGGSTNAEEGLVLAYEVARGAYREGAINRVILCSDGVANVGRTGPESILARIGDEARGGIELTTVGFGMGNYNDVLMEQLADRGDGAYAYVDDLDEARRIFVENLTGTLQTIARDAKIQVEVDPDVVTRYRLLGYENRDVPDERFRDDTVDAGEVGAGHAVSALYELKLRDGIDPNDPKDRERTAATVRLRWRSVERGRVEEMTRRVTVGELAGEWREESRSLRLASVVAEFAEALKGTYWARGTDLDELFRRAQRVSADFPGDLRVAELVTTIGRAARIPTE